MKEIALAAVVAACAPEPGHSANYVTPMPQQPAQPTPACDPQVPMAQLPGSTIGSLPSTLSADDALNAAVQFIASAGMDVDTVDRQAHVLSTKPVVGQTVLMSCRPINLYRVYKFRLAVIGHSLAVSAECWGSSGWEANADRGTFVPAHRDAIEPCTLVSEGDSKIPQMLVDGTLAVLGLAKAP